MTQGDFCEREIGHDGEHRRRPPAPSLDRVAALAEELWPGEWKMHTVPKRPRFLAGVRIELLAAELKYLKPTLSAAVAAACAELERLVKEKKP